MKLLIVDHPAHHDYTISGEVINGIDLSVFPADATFKGNADTDAAGIHNVERIEGELHVTLGQHGLLYECAPVNGSHDWFGTGEWIDAADYDDEQCYIVATAAPENADYEKRSDGWTVTVPVVEEPEEPEAGEEQPIDEVEEPPGPGEDESTAEVVE
ncbi:hypothetical protein [Vreelandella titanicae]|uniref:Uncharacterized protein n=1 Tax=Vreelandella titanicae TaxID=664683 RepID=A0AAP9NLY8_9GAMM|nr:hypothetical protein [Halomonas titanicae]QKS24176.1 hypothetical protein FX987_01950 [Halomonas titanicae]